MSGSPSFSDYMQARFNKWSPIQVFMATSGSVFLFLVVLSILFALGVFAFTGGVLPASLGFLLFLKPVMMPLVLGLGVNGAIAVFGILSLLVLGGIAAGFYILLGNIKQFKPENIKPAPKTIEPRVIEPVPEPEGPEPALAIDVQAEHDARRAAEEKLKAEQGQKAQEDKLAEEARKAQAAAEQREKSEAEERVKAEEQKQKAQELEQAEKLKQRAAEQEKERVQKEQEQKAQAEQREKAEQVKAQAVAEQREKSEAAERERVQKEEEQKAQAEQGEKAKAQAEHQEKVAEEQVQKEQEKRAEEVVQAEKERVKEPAKELEDKEEVAPPPEPKKEEQPKAEEDVKDEKGEREEADPKVLQDPSKHGEFDVKKFAAENSARWIQVGYQLLANLNAAQQEDLDSKGFEEEKGAETSLPAWLQLKKDSQLSEALYKINKQFLLRSGQRQGVVLDEYAKIRQLYLTAIICMAWAIYSQAAKEGSEFGRGAYTLQGEKLHACLRDYIAFATRDSKPEEVAPPWTAVLGWKTSEFAYTRDALPPPQILESVAKLVLKDGKIPLSSHEVEQQFGIDLRFFSGELACKYLPYQHSHILLGTKQGASYLKFEPEGIATQEFYDHMLHYQKSGEISGVERREKDRPKPLSEIYIQFLKDLHRSIPSAKKLPPVFVMYQEICARPEGQEHAVFKKAQEEFEAAAEKLGYRKGLERRIGNECQLDLTSFVASEAEERSSYGAMSASLIPNHFGVDEEEQGNLLSRSVIIKKTSFSFDMMEGYIPVASASLARSQSQLNSEEEDEKEQDLGGSWEEDVAAPQSGGPGQASQEPSYVVGGRYTPTGLALITRHKMKGVAGYSGPIAIVQDGQNRRMISFYEKDGRKAALFEPVADSRASGPEKGMYTLSFALKKYQEYITSEKQNTCDELIIPLAKNGQVGGADTYQHWVFLHIKYDTKINSYTAVLHDSKSYYSPGWFYSNTDIKSAIEEAFPESEVTFAEKYHGAQGAFNNQDCGPFVAEYIQRVACGEEIPEDLTITEEVRQGHEGDFEKQRREERLNDVYKRFKLSCIKGLIGENPVQSIEEFKGACEGLIGEDINSQVAVLFSAECTLIDEVFGRDTGDGIEERRFKKLMYRLGAGLLGFKDKDISKDLDKKEEYQAKKDALVFIVELMQALSTVVKEDRLKELPSDSLLKAIKEDDIKEAIAIMETSFLQLEFFSYIDKEMMVIRREEIGELKDKYEGLEAKQKDPEGWREVKSIIERWEAEREERILDLMEGEGCRGFLFPASASPASQNLPR